MVNLSDPNTRHIEPDPSIDRYMIYSACRGGLEDIGAEVTDADESKGLIKGRYMGNKKRPVKVQFKKMKKGGFGIRISHKFKISNKNFQRRDLRDLPLDKYDEAIIVKFWDAVFRELDLGLAPGFGDKELASADNAKIEKLKNHFGNQLAILLNDDPQLDRYVTEINQNQRLIRKKYKWELRSINNAGRWPQETIYAVELFMDKQKSREKTIVITVNTVDLKTVTKLPIMINVFIAMPRALPKELNMSYKCQWTSPAEQMDDISQKIIHHMNFEMSSLENRLKQLYEDEYLYHFEFKETFEDKGKKSKIEHDQLLLYPINVMEIMNPTSDDQRFLLVMKYFLEINRRGNYDGLVPVIRCLKIMSDLIKGLKRFYIATEDDKRREDEKQRIKAEEKTPKASIRKCWKCDWLLSEGTTKCPMCGSEVRNIKKKSFGIESSEYDKSSALLGAKEKAYSDRLLSAFDTALDDWGDAESKIGDAVKDVFLGFLENPQISEKIVEIIENHEEVKEQIGKAFKINEDMYSGDSTVIGRYLIKLMGHEVDWIYVILEILDTPKEHIFPVLVNYVARVPYNRSKISYFVERADSRWSSDELKWQIDVGDDTPLVKGLKNQSDDLNETLKQVYSADNRNQYIEPELNKRGKVKGIEYQIDLYPLMRIEPFYKNEIRPGNLVTLRQFLDYEQSDWIPLEDILDILDMIHKKVKIFEEEFSLSDKEGGLDLSMLDRKIEESKYSYKKKHGIDDSTVSPTKPQYQEPEQSDIAVAGADDLDLESELDSELDSLLGSDDNEELTFEENYIEKTTFYDKLPGDFNIDSMLSDKEIDNLVYQLKIEIDNIMELAEEEINSLAQGENTYTSCMEQVERFRNQIEEKQVKIRAYEYEKHRIRLDRLEIA